MSEAIMKDFLGNVIVEGDTVLSGNNNELCPGVVVKNKGGGLILVKRLTKSDTYWLEKIDTNPAYYNYLGNATSLEANQVIRMPQSLLPEDMQVKYNHFLLILKSRNYIK